MGKGRNNFQLEQGDNAYTTDDLLKGFSVTGGNDRTKLLVIDDSEVSGVNTGDETEASLIDKLKLNALYKGNHFMLEANTPTIVKATPGKLSKLSIVKPFPVSIEDVTAVAASTGVIDFNVISGVPGKIKITASELDGANINGKDFNISFADDVVSASVGPMSVELSLSTSAADNTQAAIQYAIRDMGEVELQVWIDPIGWTTRVIMFDLWTVEVTEPLPALTPADHISTAIGIEFPEDHPGYKEGQAAGVTGILGVDNKIDFYDGETLIWTVEPFVFGDEFPTRNFDFANPLSFNTNIKLLATLDIPVCVAVE